MDFQLASKLNSFLCAWLARLNMEMLSNRNWFNLNKTCKFLCGLQQSKTMSVCIKLWQLVVKTIENTMANVDVIFITTFQLVWNQSLLQHQGGGEHWTKPWPKLSSRNVHTFFGSIFETILIFHKEFSPSSKTNRQYKQNIGLQHSSIEWLMPSTFLIEFCIPSHLKNEVSCDQHKSWLQLKIFYGIKIKYESKSFESKHFCNEYWLTDWLTYSMHKKTWITNYFVIIHWNNV